MESIGPLRQDSKLSKAVVRDMSKVLTNITDVMLPGRSLSDKIEAAEKALNLMKSQNNVLSYHQTRLIEHYQNIESKQLKRGLLSEIVVVCHVCLNNTDRRRHIQK